MAFSKEMDAAMADKDFVEKIGKMENEDEVIAAFNERGVDIKQEIISNTKEDAAEGELTEDQMEDVSGGISWSLAVKAWKAGKTIGIGINRAYEKKKYGRWITYP